jgi:hypothetical protein
MAVLSADHPEVVCSIAELEAPRLCGNYASAGST